MSTSSRAHVFTQGVIELKWLMILSGAALLVLAVLVAVNAGALGARLVPGLPGPAVTVSGGAVIGAGRGLRVGDPAPEVALRALDGETVRLSDYAGRPVLVNFWASWCPPCRAEMPRFEEAHAAGRVVVLGVNTLDADDEAEARAAARDLGVTFPVLFDEQGDAQRAYSVRGLPTTFLVGPDGRILAVRPGEISQALLDEYLAMVR